MVVLTAKVASAASVVEPLATRGSKTSAAEKKAEEAEDFIGRLSVCCSTRTVRV